MFLGPFGLDASTSTCAPSGEIGALLRNVSLNRSSGATGAAETAAGITPRIKAAIMAKRMSLIRFFFGPGFASGARYVPFAAPA